MLILALDTTSEMGGVGIFRDAECLALVPNSGPANQYAVRLFELVEQALAQAQVRMGDIDLFAAANGPGSFTGIRVGLAAARAWGKAFTRPVRGVSVLEAMVNSTCLATVSVLDAVVNSTPLATDWAFPIMDARRGEFFVEGFRKVGLAVEPGFSPATSESGPQCGPQHAALKGGSTPLREYEPADDGWIFRPDSLRGFIEEQLARGRTATCVVQAHDQSAVALRAALPASVEWRQIEGTLVNSIADIARKEEQTGVPCPPSKLDAFYIRRPDAEVKFGAGD